MSLTHIANVIPEANIVVLSPHFDDFLFFMGGYVLELKKNNLLKSKNFHINVVFSRSNYTVGAGAENYNKSLERIKYASGQRIFEDMNCIDDLLGRYQYTYELGNEDECLVRGSKTLTPGSEMEFPHGMYEDFDAKDNEVLARMKQLILKLSTQPDTAIVLPLGYKEHLDHFIVREAGILVAREQGSRAHAQFYFCEDKPYSGLSDETELGRVQKFIQDNQLECRGFRHHPQEMIDTAYRHYLSQVEEIYKTGILQRSAVLQKKYGVNHACDQIFTYHP